MKLTVDWARPGKRRVSEAVHMAVHDEASSALQPWLLVLFITFLTILSLLDRNIISLFLDEIRNDLAISEVQASLIYGGAFAITFSLMGLPMGWAVDRISRRKVICAGVSVWSISTAACGLAPGFPSMLLARAGVGAGEAALVPSAHAIISDSFPPEKRTLPFAFYAMGQKAGAGIALLVGGFLAAIIVPHLSYELSFGVSLKGWQIILISLGLPGILIAFMIFAFPEPPRTRNPSESTGYIPYLAYMRQNLAYFSGHHLGFIFAQSIYTGIMAWTPAYFTRVHGWSAADVGFWFGAVILVGPLVSLPAHGWICDRLLRRGVTSVHLNYQLVMLPLGVIPICGAYLISDPVGGLILLGIGMTLIAGSAAATSASLQLSIFGSMRGKAASVWMLTGALASFVGPSGIALVNEELLGSEQSIGQSMAIFITMAAVAAVLCFALARSGFRALYPPRTSAE